MSNRKQRPSMLSKKGNYFTECLPADRITSANIDVHRKDEPAARPQNSQHFSNGTHRIGCMLDGADRVRDINRRICQRKIQHIATFEFGLGWVGAARNSSPIPTCFATCVQVVSNHLKSIATKPEGNWRNTATGFNGKWMSHRGKVGRNRGIGPGKFPDSRPMTLPTVDLRTAKSAFTKTCNQPVPFRTA